MIQRDMLSRFFDSPRGGGLRSEFLTLDIIEKELRVARAELDFIYAYFEILVGSVCEVKRGCSSNKRRW